MWRTLFCHKPSPLSPPSFWPSWRWIPPNVSTLQQPGRWPARVWVRRTSRTRCRSQLSSLLSVAVWTCPHWTTVGEPVQVQQHSWWNSAGSVGRTPPQHHGQWVSSPHGDVGEPHRPFPTVSTAPHSSWPLQPWTWMDLTAGTTLPTLSKSLNPKCLQRTQNRNRPIAGSNHAWIFTSKLYQLYSTISRWIKINRYIGYDSNKEFVVGWIDASTIHGLRYCE